MELDEILEYKYVPIDDEKNIFNNMDPITLKKIIELYYSGEETVKKIVATYELSLDNTANFSKHLPSYYMETKCPYDGTYLTASLPSKSALNFYWPDGVCLECGHKEYSNRKFGGKPCDCLNCQEKEEVEKKKVLSVLQDTYTERIKLKDITVIDRINIAALLQSIDIEYGYLIPPFVRYGGTNKNISINILRDLLDKNLLKISEKNSLDVFSDITETSFSYSPQKVYSSINIENEDGYNEKTFELLKNANEIAVNNDTELILLWREFVKKELFKLFKFKMEESKFTKELEDTERGKKIWNAFDRWLELYSPSQIYAILYKVIKDADNIRTSGNMGNFKYNEIAFIEKLADQMIIKYEKENWGIKSYNFPYKVELNIQTAIFFSKIVKEKNWFNKLVPGPKKVMPEGIDTDISLVKKYSDYSTNIETQEFDKFFISAINEAEYYYLNQWGLVIYDSYVTCLFATRQSLYEYKVYLDKTEDIDDGVGAATIEEEVMANSNFYVNGSYSSKTIYLAIRKLIKEQVPFVEEF